jgi:hypothetical protein
MWRIVCVGPGPGGTPRRVVDRGPLQPDEHRARQFAAWLSATGLYERVSVERDNGPVGQTHSLVGAEGP